MMIVEKVMSRKPGYQRIDSVWGRGAGRVGGRLVRGVLLACRAKGRDRHWGNHDTFLFFCCPRAMNESAEKESTESPI